MNRDEPASTEKSDGRAEAPTGGTRRRRTGWAWRYAATTAIAVAGIALRLSLSPWLGDQRMSVLLLAPVVMCAYFGGLGPGLWSTALVALGFVHFILPPAGSFVIGEPRDFVHALLLAAMGVLVSLMGEALRLRQTEADAPGQRPGGGSRATERKVQAGFAIALALLVAMGIVSFASVTRLLDHGEAIQRADRLNDDLHAVLIGTMNAETGQRGFVITGDEAYLEPFRQAERSLAERREDLRKLAAEVPEFQRAVDEIDGLVRQRLAHATVVIEQRRTAGFEAARRFVADGAGKRIEDEIRRRIAALQQANDVRLRTRQEAVDRSAQTALAVIVAGGVVALSVVAAALIVVGQDFARGRRTEAALREAQASLESRVAERTAALAQANDALTASEGRLRLFVEHAPAALAMFDRDMRYLTASRRWRDDYGLGDRPLAGVSHYEVFPEIGEKWKAVHRRALAGEVIHQESDPFVRADGTMRWLRWEVRPWRDAQDRVAGVVIFTEDITENHQAAAANERLAAIVESSDDAIISKTIDGTITSWNRGAEIVFGYTKAETMGRSILMLFPPERRHEEATIVARIGAGERVVHFETERIRKDGVRIFVSVSVAPVRDESGRIVGASKIVRDITARREQEQALRESEERFRSLVALSPDALFINQDNRVVYVNRSALALWRATGESQLLGRAPLELFHPDSHAAIRERIGKLDRDDAVAPLSEQKLLALDGTVIPVETTAAVFKLAGRRAIQVIVRDVTERKRADGALRFHESILRETGRIAKVGGWSFEVATGEGYWSEEVARIHDLDPTVPTSKENGLKYYTPEGRRRIEAALKDTIEHGAPYDLELELITAAGVHKWVRTIGHPVKEDGRVVRLIGSFQDVTERREAERRLATQAAVGRVLAESATLAEAAPRILQALGESERWPFGAFWRPGVDPDRLACLEVWQAPGLEAAALVEATRTATFGRGEGLPGRVWQSRSFDVIPDVTTDENYPRRAAAVAAGLRGGVGFPVMAGGEVTGVIDFLSRNPAERDPRIVDLLEMIGRQIGLFIQRRLAEEEVHQLNLELEARVQRRTAQLEAANREMEAFSYSVSHDLRAPLRTIDGFAQALTEDFSAELPAEARRYLQLIQGGAQRMGALIDDLLTLSRLTRQTLTRQTVPMRRLVDQVWADLGGERRGREIELVVGELPDAQGDPTLLRQVWFNLLENAVKYTGKTAHARIEVGATATPEGVEYRVSDNGAGFDMRYAQKLFGVFQRLHRAEEFGGTGVGLAIVQRLVQRHGGSVRAEGEVGRGATFAFTLGDQL